MLLTIHQKLTAYESAALAIRSTLSKAGAVEAWSPVLSRHRDLAPLRQFETEHPRSGEALFLRIAPEEELTLLIAHGTPAVYELAKNFRDEHPDARHMSEFMSVEALFTAKSYEFIKDLAIDLCIGTCRAVRRSLNLMGDGWIQSPADFTRLELPTFLESELQLAPEDLFDEEGRRRIADAMTMEWPLMGSPSEQVDALIDRIARMHGGPVLVAHLPDLIGGPAGRVAAHPRFWERCEMYYDGIELGSFAVQEDNVRHIRERHEENFRIKAESGFTNNSINEALISQLSGGLPPYVGVGLGIDRLVMLAVGAKHIEESYPYGYSGLI